ncbi:hypothetical protein DPEC_G00017510 [Dallia pectoralis]|uniref:Uncharacterized protein n=1 Tax=Dallia pectoralis TaxID=75939 RepID=A0ACC2HGL4_DALPE|nr:hypothetical protein DPEC_G00017510 [Dallia pectoralis]
MSFKVRRTCQAGSPSDAQKRDNEQSPIKKRFKDAAISKEELDVAIANGIKLALQEQQRGLDVVVATAVREAVDSILVPELRDLRTEFQKTNATVKEISSELEIESKSTKRTQDRVDSVQAAAREDRRAVLELRTQLDQLTTKLTDLEDRGRRNNVRLVGLPEAVEGSDAIGYLKVNLPKWIPSLVGRDIDIERAHRVYDGVSTILFFPDYSPATTAKRKSFSAAMKKARDMGLEPFLIYPARIKLQYKGEKKMFDSSQAAEDFINSLPRRYISTTAASYPTIEKNHGDTPRAREGNLVHMKE